MSFLYVKVYYGPCGTFYTIKHKPQRLYGLRDRLHSLGYRVDLIPVEYINYCMLEICGHEVYRCNVTNLKFNTYYDRDPVCQRAIQAVLQSSVKFQRAHTYFWLWNLIESEIFRRGPYSPKDYWPVDLHIMPCTTCQGCNCCKIIVDRSTTKSINKKIF